MSSDVAIRVNGLSKRYEIYERPADRLKQALIPNLFRLTHPVLRRLNNTRQEPPQYFREFWALRDVSFEIRQGEAIGIIGRNGSGKSTLLQMICGVLTPTYGEVESSGRIGALLELGTGFNPEFTGRENVYFTASVLGFSKEEVDERFDRIAAFAEIGSFMDQPVKTYSSGMVVRLAFAVQVQIEPDILIVDEALAVGDALFQKRCFQQMEWLLGRGTTLLFVSHDQELVRTMTDRAVLLVGGQMKASGTSSEVVLEYRRLLHEAENRAVVDLSTQLAARANPKKKERRSPPSRLSYGDRDAEIVGARVVDSSGQDATLFHPGDLIRITVRFRAHKELHNLNIALRLRNREGVKMYSWGTLNQDIAIWSGRSSGDVFWDRRFAAGEEHDVTFEMICHLGGNFYEVQASVSQEEDRHYGAQRMLHWQDEAAFFFVQVQQREYFFGGVFDAQMKVSF
jgi:lipopolysaccharide transport system ATP-binding protein